MSLWGSYLDRLQNKTGIDALDNEIRRLAASINSRLLPSTSDYFENNAIFNSLDNTYDYTPQLSQLNKPSYFLYGEIDELVDVKSSIDLLKRYVNQSFLTIKVIPDVGHSFFNRESGYVYNFDGDLLNWVNEID
ncbi:MAG: dienelactone hydrolase family protein [Calditrichaeota bacterium]|nr:dienelactone hydrolase family protein [Calditrichota bacterium]